MCPSYRVTRDERHVTRGRANSLRLALSGQLGPDALTSRELYDTLALCVSCKGCKRECPTGVDMAAMKVEFLHQYHRVHPRSLTRPARGAPAPLRAHRGATRAFDESARPDPRVCLGFRATLGSRGAPLAAALAARLVSRRRRDRGARRAGRAAKSCCWPTPLIRTSSPRTCARPRRYLTAAGYRVHVPTPADDPRPLCCGRTYLASGMIEEARAEARRMLATLAPFVARGVADRRARAILRARPARRATHAAARRRQRGARIGSADVRGIPRRASAPPGASKLSSASRRTGARSCTATATRKPSASCRRSSGR